MSGLSAYRLCLFGRLCEGSCIMRVLLSGTSACTQNDVTANRSTPKYKHKLWERVWPRIYSIVLREIMTHKFIQGGKDYLQNNVHDSNNLLPPRYEQQKHGNKN
jgi:hypothetical protein